MKGFFSQENSKFTIRNIRNSPLRTFEIHHYEHSKFAITNIRLYCFTEGAEPEYDEDDLNAIPEDAEADQEFEDYFTEEDEEEDEDEEDRHSHETGRPDSYNAVEKGEFLHSYLVIKPR